MADQLVELDKAFEACQRLNTNATVTQADLVTIRRALNDSQMQLKLALNRADCAENREKRLLERDADKRIAELEDQLKRSNWLKDSYLETIDNAMKCAEAVIAAVCGASKSEIKGAGAEFFADAAHYLPKKIESHVNYVKRMAGDRRCEEAETLSKTMKAERNEAVRKQLDHEKTIQTLRERVRWFESNDALKLAEARAVRISELSVELDKALKQASEAQARADAHGHRYQEAVKQIETNTAAAQAQISRLCEEKIKLDQRITYLESISPGSDSDAVTELIRRYGKLITPSGDGDRGYMVFALGALAAKAPVAESQRDEFRKAAETYEKWLDAIGRHLGLDQGVCGKWWDKIGALERLRIRVEGLRDGNVAAVAALTAQVEQLTDVIHELRKAT